MLLLTICAATDKRKGPAPAERVPIALFIVLLGVSVSIGVQTGMFAHLPLQASADECLAH